MSKKTRFIIWITVILIDFILVNVGLKGWFLGFAYGPFDSLLMSLFLHKYFVSLIIPIVLTVVVYLILDLMDNPRKLVDKVKENITIPIVIFTLIIQFSIAIVSYSEINNVKETTSSIEQSIDFHELNSISEELENVNSSIQDLESEIKILSRY